MATREVQAGFGIEFADGAAGELVLNALADKVAGGIGFTDINGVVTLNLSEGLVFHRRLTGNLTGLSFTGVPASAERAPTVRLVLRIDSTGGYIASGLPTVVWLNGRTWDDLNLAANAENVLVLAFDGGTIYGSLLFNGEMALDPYKATVFANGTYPIPTEAESIDLANVTKPTGDGTLAFNKNGGAAITVRTDFAVGDVLNVVVTGLTTTTAVRIPRYTL